MATPKHPHTRWMALFLSILACAFTAVLADDDVTTSPQQDVPEWASLSGMQLTLSTSDGHWSPLQFAVIPLTTSIGLNDTARNRGIVRIDGSMLAADSSNYNEINTTTVAYLSCDDPKDDSFIEPAKMLNDLMEIKPKAIVLYSTTKNWCSITHTDDLPYKSILSMADAGEASQALGFLNGTYSVKVSIRGNTTNDNDTETQEDSDRNSPAVAMSILYSITGLITLLFAVIIITGAVRAHRYPERYGPRRALHGRPRQSRAKGLARAVLETIPIVKFGNQTPSKPDPELDLDAITNDGNDNTVPRTTSNLSEAHRPDVTPSTRADNDQVLSSRDSPTPTPVPAHDGAEGNGDDNLGCSICTEDFKVGEDVRVLPCKHQFHPACIDPWLVNVSGTCPLCRFDLNPEKAAATQGSTSDDTSALPPPLALEGVENDASHMSHRNRASRIFDVNRLRQAPVEERMEALRRLRAEADEAERQVLPDGESRGQSARFAAKLKERFRIRTRAQAPENRDC
ncbi:hypothetical protein QQX98_012788 [Neonectria punicea]|uniref:RING-type E3 ubiquitin transferase n=1 Tax=Neonectria punicea TaxID=979145 RepID=A0ABR1GHY6_9HYPO